VRFLSRNTLIVFIAHMPLFYALRGPLARWTGDYSLRVAVQFAAGFFALAAVSELVMRAVRPGRSRR
jgi:hypothetical protein